MITFINSFFEVNSFVNIFFLTEKYACYRKSKWMLYYNKRRFKKNQYNVFLCKLWLVDIFRSKKFFAFIFKLLFFLVLRFFIFLFILVTNIKY